MGAPDDPTWVRERFAARVSELPDSHIPLAAVECRARRIRRRRATVAASVAGVVAVCGAVTATMLINGGSGQTPSASASRPAALTSQAPVAVAPTPSSPRRAAGAAPGELDRKLLYSSEIWRSQDTAGEFALSRRMYWVKRVRAGYVDDFRRLSTNAPVPTAMQESVYCESLVIFAPGAGNEGVPVAETCSADQRRALPPGQAVDWVRGTEVRGATFVVARVSPAAAGMSVSLGGVTTGEVPPVSAPNLQEARFVVVEFPGPGPDTEFQYTVRMKDGTGPVTGTGR
ncbi:hypothetical protein [Yinghuangia seranimata]|uniref:hypothetical protein n=1 Tax=Yinghuangia seranimata TaxID=408067 RepID=UPI00248B7AD8|nr:hypothetical protein [Yinghuangia seranimata]MDI2129561.1 hypothetical protein [Yinghuangia seranimata]